jgi:hypothetical protein
MMNNGEKLEIDNDKKFEAKNNENWVKIRT